MLFYTSIHTPTPTHTYIQTYAYIHIHIIVTTDKYLPNLNYVLIQVAKNTTKNNKTNKEK